MFVPSSYCSTPCFSSSQSLQSVIYWDHCPMKSSLKLFTYFVSCHYSQDIYTQVRVNVFLWVWLAQILCVIFFFQILLCLSCRLGTRLYYVNTISVTLSGIFMILVALTEVKLQLLCLSPILLLSHPALCWAYSRPFTPVRFRCIKLSPLCQYLEKFLYPDPVIGIFAVPVCFLSCEKLIAMS